MKSRIIALLLAVLMVTALLVALLGGCGPQRKTRALRGPQMTASLQLSTSGNGTRLRLSSMSVVPYGVLTMPARPKTLVKKVRVAGVKVGMHSHGPIMTTNI